MGAIITKDNRIISTGYNGLLGIESCEMLCKVTMPCERAIHAEANAIASAAKFGIPLQDTTLYCTHSPCKKCAELIIQSGIRYVWYLSDYRNFEGSVLLSQEGVELNKGEINYNFYEFKQDNNNEDGGLRIDLIL